MLYEAYDSQYLCAHWDGTPYCYVAKNTIDGAYTAQLLRLYLGNLKGTGRFALLVEVRVL